MKKVVLGVLVLLVTLLFSCNTITNDDIQDNITRKDSVEEIAQKYVKYKNIWLNFEQGRSATEDFKEIYPDFLFSLELYDEEGNQMKFEDFSDEQKEQFYLSWQEEEVKHCIEVLQDNEELQNEVNIDNIAIEEALETAGRNIIVNKSYNLFLKTYLKKRQELTAIQKSTELEAARGSSNSYGEITKDCLNPDSVQKLKKVYKQGLVLYTPDAAASSTSYFSGHVGITKEKEWNSAWNDNGLSKISYSAWGDSKPNWKGKINGVQEEPLGFWAGKSGSSATSVKVYQMCYPRTVVKFKWIFPYLTIDYFPASNYEAQKAVAYAESQSGKPYDIGEDITVTLVDSTLAFSNAVKWKTDNFYCSQLVWRSWVHASPVYDFSGLRPLVLPADFEMAMNTKMLVIYQNR